MTDRTATPEWAALAADAAAGIADLAEVVASEPGRRAARVHETGGIYFDFSKLAATAATVQRLGDLAARGA